MVRRKQKRCTGCDLDLPLEAFLGFVSTNGRKMRMSNCLKCNDPKLPKRCKKCGVTKPGREYQSEVTKAGHLSVYNVCRDCKCDLSRAYNRGTINVNKPPGWTPPPTAQQMAEWYTDLLDRTRARREKWQTHPGPVTNAEPQSPREPTRNSEARSLTT